MHWHEITKEKRSLVMRFSILSAITAGLYPMIDNAVLQHFITGKDKLTNTAAYLFYGEWINLTVAIIYLLLLILLRRGTAIDSDFKGLVFRNKSLHKAAFISGSLGALATGIYFLANTFNNPVVIITLSSLSIPISVCFDAFKKKIQWKTILLPVILAFLGALLAVWEGSLQTFLTISVTSFLLIGVAFNIVNIRTEYAEKAGAEATDAISLQCWRLVYLAICSTIVAVSISALRFQFGNMIGLMVNTFWPAIIPIVILMVLVNISFLLKIAAKKVGIVSVVLIVTTIKVFFGYFFVGIAEKIKPGYFQTLPTDIWVWIVRFIGLLLLLLSIFLLFRRKEK